MRLRRPGTKAYHPVYQQYPRTGEPIDQQYCARHSSQYVGYVVEDDVTE
jgi:hypothetical protein